jgi:hypothetical protein
MVHVLSLFVLFCAAGAFQPPLPTPSLPPALALRWSGPDIFVNGFSLSAVEMRTVTDAFKVVNVGGGALTWAFDLVPSWASFSPGTGTTLAGVVQTVNVTFSAGVGMPAGSYPGSVTLYAAGSAYPVSLMFTVRAAVGVLAAPVDVDVTLTPDAPTVASFLLVMTSQTYSLDYNVTVGRVCALNIRLDQQQKEIYGLGFLVILSLGLHLRRRPR